MLVLAEIVAPASLVQCDHIISISNISQHQAASMQLIKLDGKGKWLQV